MTNEETQKTMEFILEQQAQFAANNQRLQGIAGSLVPVPITPYRLATAQINQPRRNASQAATVARR